VNDEVVVTELMDREGWPEALSPARSRFRVVAVMLAVVLGCGLAALLVHLGSEERLTDNPNPAFDMPHGPSGGLGGGGVPPTPEETEVTASSTRIVVTDEPPPAGSNGLPWAKLHRQTSTVTPTESPTNATPPSAPGGIAGGDGSPPPNPRPNPQPNPPPHTQPHTQPNPPPTSDIPPTSAECFFDLVCMPTG
jgi:hypothetical protein